MKRAMLTGLAIALVLTIGCGQPYTPSANAEDMEAIAVKAVDLYQAYYHDTATADELYLDKLLEVTGEVSVSRNVLGTFYIILGHESMFDVWGIQCAMKDANDTRLYKLEKGDEVTIRGYCEGYSVDVVLQECVLVE
jgi:hypothetical protein